MTMEKKEICNFREESDDNLRNTFRPFLKETECINSATNGRITTYIISIINLPKFPLIAAD